MAAAKSPRSARPATRPRRVKAGDIGPLGGLTAVERGVVAERVLAKELAEAEALRDIKAKGHIPLRKIKDAPPGSNGADLEEELADDWRNGGYPYKYLLSRKSYEHQKYRLQVELLKMQAWVKDSVQ